MSREWLAFWCGVNLVCALLADVAWWMNFGNALVASLCALWWWKGRRAPE